MYIPPTPRVECSSEDFFNLLIVEEDRDETLQENGGINDLSTMTTLTTMTAK